MSIQWQIQDFPEEGAPPPQGGAKFPQKQHEIERIWVTRLDPPLPIWLRFTSFQI